jgi:drug/metabolite transporter (DMT)-like permease
MIAARPRSRYTEAAMRANLPAKAALLAATVVWGSTFVITKESLDRLTPAQFLAWRFGIAALALLAIRPVSAARLTVPERRQALLLGFALGAGFLLQTTGLLHTPAGLSGFLTGAAVIFTPIVAATLFRDRVGRAGWLAVALSAAGIAGITESATAPSPTGAALTLAGAVCFAVHIAGLSRWSSASNAYGLTAVSVSVAAILCVAVALLGGGMAAPSTARAWTSVLYLGLVATCAGLAVQAWAQSALTATTTAVTMTMEPVFAAVIAVAAGERGLSPVGWLGGLFVATGMAVAELGPRHCCDALAPRVECC